MVIDCFTYNGELDILDLRLNMLYKHVDRFVIVESKTTFSGKPKRLYFSNQEGKFKEFWHKIDYFIIDENYSKEERALADSSPNTEGAKHWKTEFLQKESIKKALWNLKDDDIVYIGDVDEIWDVTHKPLMPEKLKLRVYAYYLNNLSNEEFWGTVVAPWSYFKDKVLNHVRSDTQIRGSEYGGWHFTSMGGLKQVQRKLEDSYTKESYLTKEVQNLLPERVDKGIDYLGRPFTFKIDEEDWPSYLYSRKRRYKHLCK